MKMPSTPLHPDRKILVTLHDSTALYGIVTLLALGIFLFSLCGLGVAWSIPRYMDYAWVPGLLLVLSGILITSCTVRIVRRAIFTLQEKLDTGDGLPL